MVEVEVVGWVQLGWKEEGEAEWVGTLGRFNSSSESEHQG